MKKIVGLLLSGIFSFSAQAGIITSVENAGILSTQVSGVTTVDFEGLGTNYGATVCPAAYSTCSGDFLIKNNEGSVWDGDGSGGAAAPFSATPLGEDFLAVPNPVRSGSAIFSLDQDYNYFGLFWGSVDSYNTLAFYNGSDLLGSFGGDYFVPPLQADGGQGDWNSNRFINFYFTDGMTYDSVKLASGSYAFETDNHAFGSVSVPEPSVLALLGAGLLGLGFAGRRKQR